MEMDTDSDDEVQQPRSRKNVLEDSQSDASQSSDDGSEEDCDSEGEEDEDDYESGVEEDDQVSDGGSSSCDEGQSEDEKDVMVAPGFESDSSDGQEDRCPICLSRFTSQSIGTPENCDHAFCLECILEWAKNMNTCPVDRKNFALVFARKLLNGQIIDKISVKRGQPAGQEEEDVTSCEVCGRSDREDRLLLCDGCDMGYHLECLIPPLDAVPVEEWFCSVCARENRNGSDSEHDGIPDEAPTLPFARVTRMVPRTRASEMVRRRIQRTRTLLQSTSQPSTSGIESANNSPRPNAVRRRNVGRPRRRRRKATTGKRKRKRKTTKSSASSGKKVRRRRKTKRRTGKKSKSKYRKLPKPLVTPKHRIAQHLGLKKPPSGQSLPLMRATGVEKSILQHRTDVGIPSLRLFGDRNEFDDIAEGFSETSGTVAMQRRVANTRVLPHRKALTASALLSHRTVRTTTRQLISPDSIQVPTSFDILGNIMSGQNLLHTIDKSICIKRDGSLMKKQDGQSTCGRQVPSGPNSQESSGGGPRQGNYSANGSRGSVGGSGERSSSCSVSGRSEMGGNSDGGGGRSSHGRDRNCGEEGCSKDVTSPAPKEPSCDRRNERDKKAAEEDDIDIYSDIEDTEFHAEHDDDACDSQMEPRPLSQASEFGLEKSPLNVDYDDASSEGELVIDETVKSEVDFEHDAPSAPLAKSEESNTDSEEDNRSRDETNDQDVEDSSHVRETEHGQTSQVHESKQESNDEENENLEGADNVDSGNYEMLSCSDDSTSAQLHKQSDDNERCSSSNEHVESNDSEVRPSKEQECEGIGDGDGEGEVEGEGGVEEDKSDPPDANETNMDECSPIEEAQDCDVQLPESASPIESSEHEMLSSPESNDNAQEDAPERECESHDEVSAEPEPADVGEQNECDDSEEDSDTCLEKNDNEDSDVCDPEPVGSDSFVLEKETHCMPHTPIDPEPEQDAEPEPEPEPEQDEEPERAPEQEPDPDPNEDNEIVELAVIKRVRPPTGQGLARRRLRAPPANSSSSSSSKRSQSPSSASLPRKDSSSTRATHSQRRGQDSEEGEISDRNLQRSGRKPSDSGLGSQSAKANRYGIPPEEYAGPRINMADLPRIPKIKRTDGDSSSHGNRGGGDNSAESSSNNEVSWKKLSQNSKSRNYRDGKPKDERKYFREKEKEEAVLATAANVAASTKKDSYRGRDSDRQSNSSRSWVSSNATARDKQRVRGRGWEAQQSVGEWHDKTKHKYRDKEDVRTKEREKERQMEARHRAKRKTTRPEKDTREKRPRKSSDSRSHECEEAADKSSSRERSWDRNKSERDKRKDRDRDKEKDKEKDRDRKEKSSSQHLPPPPASKKEKPVDVEKQGAVHLASTKTYRDNKRRHRERKKPKENTDHRERSPEVIPVPVAAISSPTPEPESYISREPSPVESKEIYASGDSIIVNVNFSRPASSVSVTKEVSGAGTEGRSRSKEKELPAKRACTPLQLPPTPPEPLQMVVPFQISKKRATDSDGPVLSKKNRTNSRSDDRGWGESGFSGSEEGTRSPSCNQSDDDRSECMQAAVPFDGSGDRNEIIDISSDEDDGGGRKADVNLIEESQEADQGEKSVEDDDDKADSTADEHGSDDGNEVDIAYDPFEPTRSPSLQSSDGAKSSTQTDDAPNPTEAAQPEPPPLSDLPPLPPEPEPEIVPAAAQVPRTCSSPYPTREATVAVSSPAPAAPLPTVGITSHRGLPQMLHGHNHPVTQTMSGLPVQHSTMQMAPTMQLPNLRVPPPNFIPRSMQAPPPSGAAAVVAAAAQLNALRPLGPWAAAAAAAVAGAAPNLLFPSSQPLLRAGFLQPQLPGVNVPGPSHSVTLTQIGNLLHSQAAQLAMLSAGVRVPPPRHLNLQAANMHQALNAVTAHLHSRGNFDNSMASVLHTGTGLHLPVSANGETRRVSPHTSHSQRQAQQQDVTEVVDMDVDSPYSPADADYLSDHNSEQSDHRPAVTAAHSGGPTKDRFDALLGSSSQNRKENVPTKTMGGTPSSGRGARGEAKPSTPTSGSNRMNLGGGSSGHHHHHSHHQGSSRGDVHRSKRKSESSRKHVLRLEVNPAAKGVNRKEKTDADGRKEGILKVDDAQFTILDELPSSAVEMQVKEKFLKKLNRQERVVEEVKLAIKPYYNRREVNKEEYKEILRKSVPKICHNKSGEINPLKIKSLVDGYVKMFKHQRKKDSKSSKK